VVQHSVIIIAYTKATIIFPLMLYMYTTIYACAVVVSCPHSSKVFRKQSGSRAWE